MLLSLKNTFRLIYEQKLWGDDETLSGACARLEEAQALIHLLPRLMQILDVHSLLDVGCGDFNWMQYVNLDGLSYHGIDLVDEVIASNQQRFQGPGLAFSVSDLTHDDLPAAELILIRDVWTHLSFVQIHRCMKNLLRHDFSYLLTTTYAEQPGNRDIESGLWRSLNLQVAPFDWPAPLKLLPEYAPGKSLGLWSLADLRPALQAFVRSGV